MSKATLTKDDFWKIIENAHASKDQTEDEYLDTLQAALVKLGPENIVRFQEFMDEYGSLAYVPGLWEAADVINGGCSSDGFINFRAWLMAQGKEVYLKALADPDSLAALDLPFDSEYTVPGLCSMESFLYVPSDAYAELGQDDLYNDTRILPEEVLKDIRSEIRYASSIVTPKLTKEEIEAALPRLCEKSPGSHEPGWANHVYSDTMKWGCDWAMKSGSPWYGPKL